MSGEKHGYERAPSPPPIPSYEEATSSRNTTARLGPDEVSDDAERQGLLNTQSHSRTLSDSRRRHGYYQPPSVQSVEDDEPDLGSDRVSGEEDSRQIMEEMEILDPDLEEGQLRRRRSTSRFSKRLYSITHSLSSFNLPRIRLPTWRPDFTFLRQLMPTIPEEYRPGWSIVARLCGLILIITLVYLLVVSEVVPMGGTLGQPFNPEWVRQTAMTGIETSRIEKNLDYITSYDHVAGTEGSYVLGQYIENKFRESHMDTYTHDDYWVYMNYAKQGGRKVAIVSPSEKAWVATLEEPAIFNPPRAQTPAYHAFSASGNVTGPLIYVNYCDKLDFKRLWDSAIDVQGAVALCRQHGTQPNLAMKVKAAQDAGVVGVLVYSDPADDGLIKGTPWPDGKWRPGESVQRGSIAATNMILGDVLTPGRPSIKKQERMSKENNAALPKIPSLPLSWKDAQILLRSLQGAGQELPEEWVGGVPDVGASWFSGHPDTSPQVNLQNEQDEVQMQHITNVFGSLRGIEDPAQKIIVGNHRDSWCFGAADPGSGTAIMLEVMRVLGALRTQGWRPLRTIEFASWDSGEYNRAGSTEHVEANADVLRGNAVAYLNVDVGVTGDKLWATGSPIFTHAWTRVLDRLTDPHENKTLKELWSHKNSKLSNPNAGSDDMPFMAIGGTSAMSFGFSNDDLNRGASNPMSGSCYETAEWMRKYADPDLKYHTLLAQMWILLILELAQEPIIPMKIDQYAHALQEEALELFEWTEKKSGGGYIDMFKPLVESIGNLRKSADTFHRWDSVWYDQVYATGGFEAQTVTTHRIHHNDKIAMFESDLLDLPRTHNDQGEHGLPGRDQYKHIIFASDINNPLEASVFPYIRDKVEKGDMDGAVKMLQKTVDILNRASKRLRD